MIEFIKSVSSEATLGVWRITESNDQLIKLVLESEINGALNYHPKKKKEHLASRALIAKVVEHMGLEYHGIQKDEHGKPFLKGNDFHLSITHNDDYVGCLIHRSAPCGLDIEHPRKQLFKIMRKFLNLEEQQRLGRDLKILTKAWSAKETIYKIYGRKNLHFSEDIQIIEMGEHNIKACVETDEIHQGYNLVVEPLDSSFLVYST